MRRENFNYLAVGLFVTAMAVLLLVILFRITGRALHTESYYTAFDNITGISRGSPVTFGGYLVGQVDSIAPLRRNGHTQFRLELAVRAGWPIPEGSVARITAPGLLAEYQVDIVEGSGKGLLAPGAEIEAEQGGGLFGALESLVSQIQDLSASGIKPLLESINRQVNVIGDELSGHLGRIGRETTRVLERIDQGAERLTALLDDGNRRHLSNVMSNADEISGQLKELTQNFTESGALLGELLRNSNRLLAENGGELDQSVGDLRATLGVVRRDIDAIIYNLDATSRNLNEFSRQLRDNPAALLNARPPRDEGVEEGR